MENIVMKKKFGQNFLKNANIVNNIVDSVIPEGKSLVIEVGPGAGAMTRVLADKFTYVLAYEIDKDLKPVLEKLFSGKSNVSIIFDDFMKRDIINDIKKFDVDNIYFMANLPYYITTPIITKVIDLNIDIKNIVVMVQKEVADRFCAEVGTKNYGSLTVFLNYYYDIKRVCNVSRNNFYPVPNVDSVVVSFTRKKELFELNDKNHFFKLVRDSFRYKRKTIRNNLKGYDLEVVDSVLKEYNFSLSSRAEELPVIVFVKISNALTEE